jgi:hypothetical protein
LPNGFRRRVVSLKFTQSSEERVLTDFVDRLSFTPVKLLGTMEGYSLSLRFQSKPIEKPVFLNPSDANASLAIICFDFILSYTGLGSSTKKGGFSTAVRLLRMGIATIGLRDEIFFQLVQQTKGNPGGNCLLRTWHLILFCANVFPPSRGRLQDLKVLLRRSLNSVSEEIRDYAQFAFIRFLVMMNIGKVIEPITIDFLVRILRDVKSGHSIFGVSIGEQLFHQKVKYPELRVPCILHFLVLAIIRKISDSSETVFRTSENPEAMAVLIKAVNNGGDISELFAQAKLADVAGLLLLWFKLLPIAVIDRDLVEGLVRDDRFTFVSKLPSAQRSVIEFLCGFIHQLANNATGNVSKEELVDMFARVIVNPSDLNARAVVSAAQELLLVIIERELFKDVYQPDSLELPSPSN